MPQLITSTIILETFDGNGSTVTPYPIAIQRERDEDLFVMVDGEPIEDFTIAEDGMRTGDAVAPGTEVVIYRSTPQTQTNPFPANTTPAPEDVRAALNKLTLIVQELNKGAGQPGAKALTFPINEPGANDTQLPIPFLRRNKIIGFDPSTGELTLFQRNSTIVISETAPSDTSTGWFDPSDGTYSVHNGVAWVVIGSSLGSSGGGGGGLVIDGVGAGDMVFHNGGTYVRLPNPGTPGSGNIFMLSFNPTSEEPTWLTVGAVSVDVVNSGGTIVTKTFYSPV